MPESMCQQAKHDFEKAKRETAFRLEELERAEAKLTALEAVQPPDAAAIEAQQAKVKQAHAQLNEAREIQKDRKETMDDLCNPHP
ncbi:hypothetical protein ABT330_06380 [Streptomyces sp. NPDC000658]|uniref:hypothetical protein n=1 Tax=Streptomyces sp. NPDC000658 TaxID=3154266 RepID=UPI00331D214B